MQFINFGLHSVIAKRKSYLFTILFDRFFSHCCFFQNVIRIVRPTVKLQELAVMNAMLAMDPSMDIVSVRRTLQFYEYRNASVKINRG